MSDIDELDFIQPDKIVPGPAPTSWDCMKLTGIKGIGDERALDISRIYDSESELVEALKNDEVPLRNDVVKLLKAHYNIQKEVD